MAPVIAVLIPCYNEEVTVATVVRDFQRALPEAQFFAIGKTLARIERGMQWAIGDWYNAIPHGDKKAACEQVGINSTTATMYGSVAKLFPIQYRLSLVPFSHYLSLDYKGIVQCVIEQLPVSASKKVKREVQAVLEQLKHDFQDAVEREVNKRVQADKEMLLAWERDVRAKDGAATKMLQGITAYMTEEEYNLIRGLLHPGRHPGEEQERYTKAFEVFKRLKDMINPTIPVSVLRARGWA